MFETDISIENARISLDSTNCSTLTSKWLNQITIHRQHISTLMQKVLAEKESSNSSLPIPAEISPPFTIFDRLKIQQKNLLHIISNLILTSPSTTESKEEFANAERKLPLIPWLREKGYCALAEKLDTHEGYPWDEFKKMRSPILIEQLVNIHQLCICKVIKEEETKQIIEFAIYLVKIASSSHLHNEYFRSYEIVNDTKHFLGQLIYLINQDPATALRAIDKPHYQDALEEIKNIFNNYIQEICERLQNYYLAHDATQLQNPEVALYTRIPMEIGKALLTDLGTINIGIIDALSAIFLSHESRLINHETNLAHALTLLQRSPQLRAEFEKIDSPHSTKTPSNSVIRAALELSPNDAIGPLEARLTVLVAILSHLRQGGDRSCFAVSLAIEILSSHLGFCFKDLRQLLEEGKLIRRIKKVKKDIPFAKRINDDNLHKEIIFNDDGELFIDGQKKAPLWEAPGLLAACQAIGITNTKATIQTVIRKLHFSSNTDKLHHMEIRALIAEICEECTLFSSHSTSLDSLYQEACFAFSTQTAHPLLKVWENAIANMAEAEEGSMIKTAILESILDTLQFKLGQLSIPPTLLLQRFFLCAQKWLYEHIQLQYDPTITPSTEGNAHSVEGGFVLYDKHQKIEGEKSFRLFLREALHEVDTFLRKEMSDNTQDIQQLDHTLDILKPFLDSKECMEYLLVRYHHSNKFIISHLTQGQTLDYTHLKFTPWLTQTGNDSKALLKIYLESEKPIQSEKFIISGAEEALTNIIEMCKHMSEGEKELYLSNPNKLKPLCILGKHRLPFMAGNPSLSSAWTQECSTKAWIEQFVIHPGRQIAETTIDQYTKQNVLHHLENIFNHAFAAHTVQLMLSECKKIEDCLTIKQYRNRIIKNCVINPSLSKAFAENLIRQIDTAFCDSLATPLKKMLQDTAVHFADTNWCKGIQDLHFCFAVNPGTGELELWEAEADGSHLTALDQNYWLFNQKWEFLTLPEDLIPDDSSYLHFKPSSALDTD